MTGIVFTNYDRYVMVLKWLTLSLFAYVAALFAAHVHWGEALAGLLVPRITWSADFFTTLVAILGTTISPYLFFWQASQEAEDVKTSQQRESRWCARRARPATHSSASTPTPWSAWRFPTSLRSRSSSPPPQLSTRRASPMSRPQRRRRKRSSRSAGEFAFILFALGIIGTGLLAVPVLAGSAAYAIGEACKWPVGLSRHPTKAAAFYATLTAAAVLGVAITLSPIDPIKALYWTAVINGVVAVPVMTVMMLMTAQPRIMGKFTISGWLRALGWASTLAMAACVIGMVVGWFG